MKAPSLEPAGPKGPALAPIPAAPKQRISQPRMRTIKKLLMRKGGMGAGGMSGGGFSSGRISPFGMGR